VTDESRLEAIRKNSQLVIATLGAERENLALNRESVAWIEGFIKRQRGGADSESLASTVACFLGEAIIAAAGGQWADDSEGGLGVRLPNGDWCFPFAKAAKQFANGVEAGDGVLGFYDSALALAARRV
jgi:hypothetical protein